MDLCDYLNESQAEAVAYCDGPELVIAGAGSGKTRVLTYKVAYLIEEKGYLPYNILSLTFTNKAANEMKSRIADIVGADRAKQLWMGTFHSIFLKILKIEHEAIGFSADLIVYDTSDSKSMIHFIIKEMGLDDKTYKPGVVLGRISNAKNHLISPSAYENNYDLINADRHAGLGALCRIYRTYWDRCKASGIMDFDDILVYTYILLSSNEEIADKYRRRFKYILVDEYQDTNFVQHSIMLQLTKSHHNICVVGDDAQSIYSFRGANIENILSFRESYPETKLFKLECNYRSTGYIVDAANSLIANNRKQLKKKVFSNREMGNPIAVMPAYSDIEEGMIVAHKVKSLCRKGYGYKDCAILYRTNAQSRIFEETLRKFSIPYKIYGGLSFYQRKEIKDVTAYFRFVCNHYDEEAFRRIINYPKRGIGPATVNNIFNIAGDNRVGVWDVITDIDSYAPDMSKATKTKIKSFADMITGMSEFVDNAYEAGINIVRQSGIMKEFADNNPENEEKRKNLEELVNGMASFYNERLEEDNEAAGLIDFLSTISLLTDQDEDNSLADRITLMTVHAAKGLEFANVFIVGLEENLFPSQLSYGNQRELEEERRLFYVALTRAKDNCFLSYAKSRFRFGKMEFSAPSRFVSEISPEYLNYDGIDGKPAFEERKVVVRPDISAMKKISSRGKAAPASGLSAEFHDGQRVKHARFGLGTVKCCEDEGDNARAVIEFDNFGEKTLLLKYAKLEKA